MEAWGPLPVPPRLVEQATVHEVLREPGRSPAATLPGPASLLPMPRPAPPPAQPAAVRRLPDAKGPLCSPHGSSGHLKRLPLPSRPLPGAPLGPEPREGGVLRPAGHARPGLERCRHVGTFYLRPRRSSGLAPDLSSVVDIVHCCPPPHPSAVRIRTDTPASGPASPSAGAHSDPSPSPQGLGCEFCLWGCATPHPRAT